MYQAYHMGRGGQQNVRNAGIRQMNSGYFAKQSCRKKMVFHRDSIWLSSANKLAPYHSCGLFWTVRAGMYVPEVLVPRQ